MKVKIYQPTKSAMQSGKGNTRHWLLVPLEEKNPRRVEPVMGWVSSDNTESQLKIYFNSKEDAIEYADSKNFTYEIHQPEISSIKKKSYAENFTN